MYKNILFLLIIFLLSCKISAQDWNEIYYLEGEAQFLIEEKQYDKAIDVYRRMIREVPDHSYAKYKIGQLYLKTDGQKDHAIQYLEEASQNIALDFDEKSIRETRTPVDVLLFLGEAYQIQNRINEAIVVYTTLKGLIKETHELYPVVTYRLQTCENAKIALANPLRVSKENMGEPLNDENPNFSPVISGDGKTIIYTSYTRNYLDNYYSVKENGTWSTPKKISEKLSTKFYLKTSSLSYDGTQLYLVTDDVEKNDIYVCYKDGKNWTEAEKLHKNINGRKTNETHACIAKDKKTLYFVSDREDGYGGSDIYKSVLNEKGKWGDPENLGSTINTPYNERTPFITLDDRYLFFSSKGHSSIGGYDIYYIDMTTKDQAINLGYPANTTDDDLFFVPDNSLTSGFTSYYDKTSLGKRDIYRVSIMPEIHFAGEVINSTNGEKINNTQLEISVTETETNQPLKTVVTNNGEFNFKIDPGNYHINVNGEQFIASTNQVNVPQDYAENLFMYNVTLEPQQTQDATLADATPLAEIETVTEEIIENNNPAGEEIIEDEKEQLKKKPITEPNKEDDKNGNKQADVEEKSIIQQEAFIPETSSENTVKTYSVQLMALKNPVKVNYFKNVDDVVLTKYPDGFYRYTVGNTTSYQKAQSLKEKIHGLGYANAFIRINEDINSSYTIQIMALIIPVKPDYFKNLSEVVVTKGSDDYFRYTIGSYTSYQDAKAELTQLKSLGYNQAFIKKAH